MWYLHFDKREIVLPLEICKMWVEKKNGKSGEQRNERCGEWRITGKARMPKNTAAKDGRTKKDGWKEN